MEFSWFTNNILQYLVPIYPIGLFDDKPSYDCKIMDLGLLVAT